MCEDTRANVNVCIRARHVGSNSTTTLRCRDAAREVHKKEEGLRGVRDEPCPKRAVETRG